MSSLNKLKLILAAVWLSAGTASLAEETSLRHRAKEAKKAAPTQEDHADYFSAPAAVGQSPETLAKADELRLKTITSIEKLVNSNIKKHRKFELYLRLGELYSERHDYLRDLEMAAWDKKHSEWVAKDKKGKEPKLSNKASQNELLKSAAAFRKLVREFPNHKRTDAALYVLAKTLGRLGNDNAVLYFNQLIKSYPKSEFIPFAHLALGEFYFDNHNIPMAMASYKAAMVYKDSKVYPYAVYKLGWSYFNSSVKDEKDYQKNIRKALSAFKLVVKLSDKNKIQDSRLNLRKEAINDLVMVWADSEGINEAWDYFSTIGEKQAFYNMLERLGNIYVDQGKNKQAIVVFSRLLDEEPARKNNPGIYVTLLDLYEQENQLASMVKTASKMNELFVLESAWRKANAGDPKVLEEAKDKVRSNLHRYGAMMHARGQKFKKDVYMKAAAEMYQTYLSSFPDTEQSYEIRYYLADIYYSFKRYELAADEYTRVANAKPKDGKYLKDSAYNAVVAMNELDSKTKYEKLPTAGKVEKPITLPATKVKLVAVIDNYVRLLPNEKDGHAMRFSAAQTMFDYGHYDEAIKRFEDIAFAIPKTKQGNTAIKIILAFYAERKDWDQLIAASRKYLKNKELVAAGLGGVIEAMLKDGTYQKALELEKKGDLEKAAKMFLAFQEEFPNDQNADRALYNASLNFYKSAKVDEAIGAAKKLLKNYPKSELTANAMLDLAKTFEALAKFEDAASYYQQFAKYFPKDKNAPAALFNAAVLYKGLNKFDESIGLFATFVRAYPKEKLSEDAYLELATLNEKVKNYRNALSYYQNVAANSSDQDTKALAAAKIAVLTYSFLNKKDGERKLGEMVSFLSNKNDPPAFEARRIVASTYFMELEDEFKNFKATKIRSAKTIQADVKAKQSQLLNLAGRYEKLIGIGSGEFVVASLYRLGEMHENFAADLFNAPTPEGASQLEVDQFRTSIEKVAFPLREESSRFYEAAYQRSTEVQTFTVWTQKAYDKMTHLSPEKHPGVIEKATSPTYMSHRMEWEEAIAKLFE